MLQRRFWSDCTRHKLTPKPECSLVALLAVIIIDCFCVSDSIKKIGITTELVSPPIASTDVPMSPARVSDVNPIDAGTLHKMTCDIYMYSFPLATLQRFSLTYRSIAQCFHAL